MPTPQELEEQRKRIEAQLMGGLDMGGLYTDEYGIPKMASPSYYLDFTTPKGMGINLGLGMPTKESLAAQLANIRLQQELLENPNIDQQKRLDEINYEIGIDYLNKPVTQMSDPRETFVDRTPGTMLGEAPVVSSIIDTNVEPAPPYNMPAPAGQEPSLGMAMRPQSAAARGQEQLPLDWNNINRAMAKEMGQSEYDTKPLTRGLEKAYIRVRREQSSLTPQEALEEAITQIQAIDKAPFVAESDPDKFSSSGPADPYYQAFVRQTFGQNGIPDLNPVQQAYVAGQMDYQRDRILGDIFNELSDPNTEVEMVNAVIDGSGTSIKIPYEVYQYILGTNQLVGDYIYDQQIDGAIKQFSVATGSPFKESIAVNPKAKDRLATVRSYNRVGNPNAWYLSPGRKEEILSNPEKYIEGGFFTDESYTGVQAETNKMWGLRTVLTPLNFAAGTLQEYILEPVAIGSFGLGYEIVDELGEGVDYVFGTELSTEYDDLGNVRPETDINYLSGEMFSQPSEARKQARKEESPLYENNPVLANIALNKGFAGEMGNLADGLGMTGWTKFGMVSAGFAGDILDPSIGFIAGGAKMGKTGVQLAAANKKLLQTKSAGEIFKISAQSGLQEFMLDFNGISYVGGMATKRAKAATTAEGALTKAAKADEVRIAQSQLKTAKDDYVQAVKTADQEAVDAAKVKVNEAEANLKQKKKIPVKDGAVTKGLAAVEDIKQMPYGDIRLHFVDDLTKQMEVRETIEQLANQGRNADEIQAELTRRGHDIDRGYAKIFFEKADDQLPQVAVKMADEADPFVKSFIDDWDKQNAFFRELDKRVTSQGAGDGYGPLNLAATRGYSELPLETKNLIDEIVYVNTGMRGRDMGGNWWASNLDNVRGVVNQTLLRRNIFAAVPNLKNAGEIVAITRNTWAHPTKIPNIIAASNSTKLGEVLGKIAEVFTKKDNVRLLSIDQIGKGQEVVSGSVFLKSGMEVKPVFKITPEMRADLLDQMERLPNVGKRTKAVIREHLNNGFITPEDFRILKDANIDMTAKLLPQEMINVDDISKLSKKEQIRMLEAEGVRNQGFAGYVFENLQEKFVRAARKGWQDEVADTPMSATTFQQKRMFREIQNEAGTLDLRLRVQLKAMTEKKYRGVNAKTQQDYLQQYFGPRMNQLEGGRPTNSQALGAAIVGPRHASVIDEPIPFLIREQEAMGPAGIKTTYKEATLEDFILADQKALDEFLEIRGTNKKSLRDIETIKKETKQKERTRIKQEKKAAREALDESKIDVDNQLRQAEVDELAALDDALETALEDLETLGIKGKIGETRRSFTPRRKAVRQKYKQLREESNATYKTEARKIEDEYARRQVQSDEDIEAFYENKKLSLEQQEEILASEDLKSPAGQPVGTIGGKRQTTTIVGLDGESVKVQGEIFGPEALTAQATRISDTANWAMSRIFFEAKEKPTFLDRITGNQNLYRTDILNQTGKWKASQLTDAFALRVMDQPDLFWQHFETLVKEYDQLTRQPENIRVGVQTDKIVRNTGRDPESGVYSLEQIRENQSKIGIGMYYYSQGSKIVERKLLEQVDEGVLLQSDIMNMSDLQAYQFNKVFTGSNEVTGASTKQTNTAVAQTLRSILREELMSGRPVPSYFTVDAILRHQSEAGIGPGGRFLNKPADELTPDEQLMSAFVNAKNPATRKGARGELMRRYDELNKSGNFGENYVELYDITEFLDQMDDIITVAARQNELAEAIAKANGVANKHYTNMDDIDAILNGLFGRGNEKTGIAILGADQYKILKQQLFGSRSQKLTAELDKIFRETTVGDRSARATTTMFQGLASTFYLMVLGLRPKFYTNNWLTAMPIVYSSTGQNLFRIDKEVGWMDARKIAYTNPSDATYYQTAILDANGRPWTYGELNERLMAGGARNEYSFISANQSENLMAYTDDVGYTSFRQWFNKARQAKQGLGDITLKEDYLWRASAMMHDLRAGKSIEEATATARRSMFDYGDMTPQEKAIASNFLVFYTFHRQNMTHFLRALTDIRKLKRYFNTLKFDRGFEMLAESAQQEANGPDYKWNPNMFMSDYMSNRVVLYRKDVADSQSEQYYATSPAIAAEDAIAMTAQFLQEPVTMVGETLNSMTRPDLRYLIGLKGPFDKPPKRVMDQHIQAISLYSDNPNDIADVLSWAVGSKVTPVPSPRGVNGYIYPLTAGQAKQWSKNMQAIQGVGLMAPAAEMAAIFQEGPIDSLTGGVKGTKFEPFGLPERLLFSQFRVGTPEQQEIYLLYLKSKALREELAAEEKRLREMQKQKQKKP